MPVSFSIQYRGVAALIGRGAGVAAKEFRVMVDRQNRLLAEHWHRDYLPGHFSGAAAGRYAYAARGKGYSVRKARTTGRNVMLRYSGTMERMLTQAAMIRSTSRGFRMTLFGPPYLRKPGQPFPTKSGGMQPDMGAEVTTVTDAEAMAMAERFERNLLADLNGYRATHTIHAAAVA